MNSSILISNPRFFSCLISLERIYNACKINPNQTTNDIVAVAEMVKSSFSKKDGGYFCELNFQERLTLALGYNNIRATYSTLVELKNKVDGLNIFISTHPQELNLEEMSGIFKKVFCSEELSVYTNLARFFFSLQGDLFLREPNISNPNGLKLILSKYKNRIPTEFAHIIFVQFSELAYTDSIGNRVFASFINEKLGEIKNIVHEITGLADSTIMTYVSVYIKIKKSFDKLSEFLIEIKTIAQENDSKRAFIERFFDITDLRRLPDYLTSNGGIYALEMLVYNNTPQIANNVNNTQMSSSSNPISQATFTSTPVSSINTQMSSSSNPISQSQVTFTTTPFGQFHSQRHPSSNDYIMSGNRDFQITSLITPVETETPVAKRARKQEPNEVVDLTTEEIDFSSLTAEDYLGLEVLS